MKLTPQLTQARTSKSCKECAKDIEVGEKYFFVTYNDGFKKTPYGAFHKECWTIFEKKN